MSQWCRRVPKPQAIASLRSKGPLDEMDKLWRVPARVESRQVDQPILTGRIMLCTWQHAFHS